MTELRKIVSLVVEPPEPLAGVHSARSVFNGSTRVARRAGM